MYEDVAPGIGLVRVPDLVGRLSSSCEADIVRRWVADQGLVTITRTLEDPASRSLLVYGEINPCFLP